jgi:putative protein-disulfide isomerase
VTMPHLLYVADPMCSWCWGFAPSLAALIDRHGDALPLHLVMGGLRPGETRVMDAAQKATIRTHWEHVAEASGQSFDHRFFDREGFVYDTEPAARAVVTMLDLAPLQALVVFHGVQSAFYAGNVDVTQADELANIAASSGVSPEAFLTRFNSDEARAATQQHFALAQRAGIRGFPTLLGGTGSDQPHAVLANGFTPPDVLLTRADAWLGKLAPA